MIAETITGTAAGFGRRTVTPTFVMAMTITTTDVGPAPPNPARLETEPHVAVSVDGAHWRFSNVAGLVVPHSRVGRNPLRFPLSRTRLNLVCAPRLGCATSLPRTLGQRPIRAIADGQARSNDGWRIRKSSRSASILVRKRSMSRGCNSCIKYFRMVDLHRA